MSSTETRDSFRRVVVPKLKTCLPYVLSVGALLIFVTYLWRNIGRYRQLFNFSFNTLLSLLGLVLMFALINGAINYFFYRALGVFLTLNESIGLAAVNTLANQLPFAGGLVAKGVYLKRRHKLAYTHFLSATMALYVCFVAANGVIGSLVLGAWWLTGTASIPLVLVLGFLGMTFSLVSLWLPIDAVALPGRIGQRLTRLAEGWRMLGRHLRLVFLLIGLQVSMTLLFAGRLWIAFHALSQDVTFVQCVLFSSATILTRLVNVLPGGLGVREGIVAGLASVLGFETGVSAVAVGLDRLVSTAIIIALGAVYTYILSKKVAQPLETGAK